MMPNPFRRFDDFVQWWLNVGWIVVCLSWAAVSADLVMRWLG